MTGTVFKCTLGASLARMLSFGVPYGDVVDVLARTVNELDWTRGMEARGEWYRNTAEAALRDGRRATAREQGLRASACYHYAQFKLSSAPDLKRSLQRRSREAYHAVAGLFAPQAHPVSVSLAGSGAMPGYLRVPSPGAPCVVLVNGLDSAKEVELHRFAEVFLERGLATLTIDGPGQGELAGASSLSGFAEGFSRWLDFLSRGPGGVGPRVGVFGVSFGGHLAALAAAEERRVVAAVSLGGFFDGAVLRALPPPARAALRRAFGAAEDEPVEEVAARVTLEPLRGRMDRPFLIVHGSRDHLVDAEQVERMRRWAPASRVWVLEGAEHVCANRFADLLPRLGDWMAAALGEGAPAFADLEMEPWAAGSST